MNPLPLTRARLIAADVRRRDLKSARDWSVSIVATSLVFAVVAVASALAGMLP